MTTFGSLFSGIGGFDLGLEFAGLQCEWQCERNGFAIKILERHWPNVKRFKDVRDVNGRNAATVDVIVGGFPCQDLSIAGSRKGLAGEQSGLWFEFYRILKDMQPKLVVIENVPGLLSNNDGRLPMTAIIETQEWLLPRAANIAKIKRFAALHIGTEAAQKHDRRP